MICMDYVLRSLRQDLGVPIANRIGHGDVLRLAGLAYADDVVILAPTPEALQTNLQTLQSRALSAGLRLNLGANKTEWYSSTAPNDSQVLLIDGRVVKRTASYSRSAILQWPSSPRS